MENKGPEESKILWKGIQNENTAITTTCNTQAVLVSYCAKSSKSSSHIKMTNW